MARTIIRSAARRRRPVTVAFKLDDFLKRHPAAAGTTNLDTVFSDPARQGKLLEMPSNLPDALVAAIGRELGKVDFNRYPVRAAEDLRAEIARWLDLPAGHTALFGNGAFEIIELVMQCLRPGAGMLMLDPDFFFYRRAAAKHGVALQVHALRPAFDIDLDALVDRIGRMEPDLIVLSNPHNPTAAWFGPETIEAILERAPGLVLVDEVYAAFAPEPDACLALLDRYPNLLLLRSFSKVGAAAIRFGYLLGHGAVLERIGDRQSTFAVSGLSLMIARLIIRHHEAIEQNVRALVRERDAMAGSIAGLAGATVMPSATNFIVLRPDDRDAETVHARLAADGVAVMHYRGMPMLENCLRMSVDTAENNVRAIARIEAALSS